MPRRRSASQDPDYAQIAPLASRENLAERTYRHLFSAIFTLKIKPGEELNEVRLAQRLGVSVTPVREALLRLSGDGLVVREPQRPPRVVKLDAKDIAELYDVRAALESFAAAEAARRVTEQDLARLRVLQDDGRRFAEGEERAPYDRYNDSFHQTILTLADNGLLTRTIQPVLVKTRLCMYVTSTLPGRRFHGVAEHEEIIGRLTARDATGAAEAMRRHVDAAKRSYLENYAKLGEVKPAVRRPRGRPRRATQQGLNP